MIAIVLSGWLVAGLSAAPASEAVPPGRAGLRATESGSCNAVQFDVHCERQDIIDQQWTIDLTVHPTGEPGPNDFSFQVNLPRFTHEDAIPALIKQWYVERTSDADRMEVQEIEGGPDRLVLSSGSISATADPTDRSGRGQIEEKFSRYPVPQLGAPPSIASIQIELLAMEGATGRFSLRLSGDRTAGGAYIHRRTVALDARRSLEENAAAVVAALQDGGVNAQLAGATGIRIDPAPGTTIEDYTVSLGLVEPIFRRSTPWGPTSPPIRYGLRVDHLAP